MDDQTILDGLRRGDREALALLASRYRDPLVAYVRRVVRDREDAQDVVQEVFLKASDASVWKEAACVPGWLYATAYRRGVDRLRARRVRQRAAIALQAPPSAPAEEAVDVRDEHGRVALALHELDEPYRTALCLRYVEGLEFREIAKRMKTVERTARTWVGRGLTRLRQRLGRSSS